MGMESTPGADDGGRNSPQRTTSAENGVYKADDSTRSGVQQQKTSHLRVDIPNSEDGDEETAGIGLAGSPPHDGMTSRVKKKKTKKKAAPRARSPTSPYAKQGKKKKGKDKESEAINKERILFCPSCSKETVRSVWKKTAEAKLSRYGPSLGRRTLPPSIKRYYIQLITLINLEKARKEAQSKESGNGNLETGEGNQEHDQEKEDAEETEEDDGMDESDAGNEASNPTNGGAEKQNTEGKGEEKTDASDSNVKDRNQDNENEDQDAEQAEATGAVIEEYDSEKEREEEERYRKNIADKKRRKREKKLREKRKRERKFIPNVVLNLLPNISLTQYRKLESEVSSLLSPIEVCEDCAWEANNMDAQSEAKEEENKSKQKQKQKQKQKSTSDSTGSGSGSGAVGSTPVDEEDEEDEKDRKPEKEKEKRSKEKRRQSKEEKKKRRSSGNQSVFDRLYEEKNEFYEKRQTTGKNRFRFDDQSDLDAYLLATNSAYMARRDVLSWQQGLRSEDGCISVQHMKKIAEQERRRSEKKKDDIWCTQKQWRSYSSSPTHENQHTRSQPVLPSHRPRTSSGSPTHRYVASTEENRSPDSPTRPGTSAGVGPDRLVWRFPPRPQPAIDFELYEGHNLVLSEHEERRKREEKMHNRASEDVLDGLSVDEVKKMIKEAGGRVVLNKNKNKKQLKQNRLSSSCAALSIYKQKPQRPSSAQPRHRSKSRNKNGKTTNQPTKARPKTAAPSGKQRQSSRTPKRSTRADGGDGGDGGDNDEVKAPRDDTSAGGDAADPPSSSEPAPAATASPPDDTTTQAQTSTTSSSSEPASAAPAPTPAPAPAPAASEDNTVTAPSNDTTDPPPSIGDSSDKASSNNNTTSTVPASSDHAPPVAPSSSADTTATAPSDDVTVSAAASDNNPTDPSPSSSDPAPAASSDTTATPSDDTEKPAKVTATIEIPQV